MTTEPAPAPRPTPAASPTQAMTDAALIALFAALIAALGLFPSVYSSASGGTPFTMQTLGVMIAGGVLGWKRGFLSVGLFVLLVAAGLHLLAGGRGGIEYFSTPPAGFAIGFPFGAAVIGALIGNSNNLVRIALSTFVGGVVVVYAFGIAGLMINADLSFSAAWDVAKLFIGWDTFKVAIATLVIAQVRTSGLIGGSGSTRASV